MQRIAATLLLLISVPVSCPAQESVVEDRLVGTWCAEIKNGHGTWTLTWVQSDTGQYATSFEGPAPIPTVQGTFRARDGKWASNPTGGAPDGGTYAFLTDDTVSLTGTGGTLVWHRPATAEALHPGLVGTWATTVDVGGAPCPVRLTIDAEANFRIKIMGSAQDENTRRIAGSGTLSTQEGQLALRYSDGQTVSMPYRLNGDEFVLSQAAGKDLAWQRVPKDSDPTTPDTGAAEPPADPVEAQKCFDEGARLYNADDMSGALGWFLKAAELGHSKAQAQAGWHYEKGVGVAQNGAKAFEWYSRSANQGDDLGMNNLGTMYRDGMGCHRSWLMAWHWYEKSAQTGYVKAEYNLAYMYEFGLGVEQDRSLAIEWYTRAAQQGHEGAAQAARWLSDPTNVSFRTAEDRDAYLAEMYEGFAESARQWDATVGASARSACRAAEGSDLNWRSYIGK